MAILTLITHQKNIERLIRGEENKNSILVKKLILNNGLYPWIFFSQKKDGSELKSLILLNDDVNDFDYVIDCLVLVCSHTPIQARTVSCNYTL